MSQEQSAGGGGWPGLLAGGLLGLILIILTNILPILASFANVFAGINIFLLLCILFVSPLLIYGLSDSNRGSRNIVLFIYILSAILVSFMLNYIAYDYCCSIDCESCHLIMEASKSSEGLASIAFAFTVTTIAVAIALIAVTMLLLIFSWPLAIVLGLVIYDKLYLASRFSKTIIGSPLFAVPLLMVLGYEISRTTSSRQSTAYIFNKAEGTLTQHQLPKGRAPVGKLLAAIMAFLMLGLMIAAAFGV